ncbi:MAG: LLM class flavin-dependent oxidoreductase [Gammaproteobacteria bacterium]|nr:LLM class flavin-dependent oxidoreductase [Gammaproteobacteria bacterium]
MLLGLALDYAVSKFNIKVALIREAERIGELFRAGKRQEAIAAVPDEYIDQQTLIGPPDRIREGFRKWQDSGATGMIFHPGLGDPIEIVRLITASN